MNEREKYLDRYDLNFQKYHRTVLSFQLFNIGVSTSFMLYSLFGI